MTFEDFIKEKRYLDGIAEKTIVSYRLAYKKFTSSNCDRKQFVMDMRQDGLSKISCNVYIRSINSYFSWLREQGEDAPKIKLLKTESKVVAVFTKKHIKTFLSYKPENKRTHKRLKTIVCLLIDTGMRISEALDIQTKNVDFDNLFIKVLGKGDKERLVPISIHMRKKLFTYMKKYSGRFLFETNVGTTMTYRNFLRDFRKLCDTIGVKGVRLSPHGFRHFFAINYIANGGDIYRLSKTLGHADISTTEVYLKSMGIELVVESHQQLSPLSHL